MIVLMLGLTFLLTEARYANAQSLLIREITPESLLGTTATNISGNLLEGGKFNLADYRDKKIVILDFWATWCGPCRMTMPILVKASQDYKEKDIVLFGINAGEDPGTITGFLEETKLSFNVVLDPYGEIATAYGVHSLPFSIIVNKKGIIETVHLGASRQFEDILKKELDTLVEGKSLLNPTTEPTPTPPNPPATAAAPPTPPDTTPSPVKDPPTAQTVQKTETIPAPPVTTAPVSKPNDPIPPQTETNSSDPQHFSILVYIIIAIIVIGLVMAGITGLRSSRKNTSNHDNTSDTKPTE